MDIISRNDALASGLMFYFTGVPCKNGHTSKRRVNGNTCFQCERDRQKRRYRDTPEVERERSRRWKQKNRERMRAYGREWHRENAEAIRLRKQKRYAEDNARSLEVARNWKRANAKRNREAKARWKKSNPHLNAANSRRYSAAKIKRVPKRADHEAIARVYAQARLASVVSGLTYCVDHIIPLQGATVSGLHVAENLQILELEENSAKGNRLLTDD